MPQSSLDPILTTIVLVTLAIGLPIIFVLVMRFLWDRNLKLDRSKELEKLIWQLHRIATAMEQQMNVSYPAVQPGTEEPHDLAYLQQLPQPKPASAPPPQPAPQQSAAPQRPSVTPISAPSPATPAKPAVPAVQAPSEHTRHGVNSMFDL